MRTCWLHLFSFSFVVRRTISHHNIPLYNNLPYLRMLQRHSQLPISSRDNDRLYAYEHYRAPENYRDNPNINNTSKHHSLKLDMNSDAGGEISKKLFVGGRTNKPITVGMQVSSFFQEQMLSFAFSFSFLMSITYDTAFSRCN